MTQWYLLHRKNGALWSYSGRLGASSCQGKLSLCCRARGYSHWKVSRGCAAVMTPFFQASQRSLAYQFTLDASLMYSPFSILRKMLHCFVQNFSSQDENFQNFRSQDPSYFKENPLPQAGTTKMTVPISTRLTLCSFKRKNRKVSIICCYTSRLIWHLLVFV